MRALTYMMEEQQNSALRPALNEDTLNESEKQPSGRGFASMSPEDRRKIASKGGRSQGKANNPGNFANDPERARQAGRKGGQS